MTENRKRVTMRVNGNQRTVTIQTPVQIVGQTVNVSVLPVRDYQVSLFDGQYVVDPLFTEQTLETKDKKMLDDVTINPIYVADTSNLSGGITVYIGGEFIG